MQVLGNFTNNTNFLYIIELLTELHNPKLKLKIMFLLVQLEMMRERIKLLKIPTKADEREILLELGLPLGEDVKDLIRIVKYNTYQDWVRDRLYPKSYKSYSSRGRKPKRDVRKIILQIMDG